MPFELPCPVHRQNRLLLRSIKPNLMVTTITFFHEKVLASFKNGAEKGSEQVGETRRKRPEATKPAPRQGLSVLE